MDLAGLRFGHAVFRSMGNGWPQQHHNCNGDSTHVLNTHDRVPYQFTGETERRAKLDQRDIACALHPSTSGNLIPAWLGHNETCALSFMSRIWVNSGTVPRRALRRPERWWWCLLPSPSARFRGPVVEITDARKLTTGPHLLLRSIHDGYAAGHEMAFRFTGVCASITAAASLPSCVITNIAISPMSDVASARSFMFCAISRNSVARAA